MNLIRRRRLGGGGVINPLSIPGLKIWLKADTLALSDGAAVSTWADQSGNGFDFTGTGAARPVFKVAIAGARPVVRFTSGSSSEMLAPAGALGLGQNVTGLTIVAVVATPATTTIGLIGFIGTNAVQTTRFGMGRTTASAFDVFGRRLDADAVAQVTGGAFTANAFSADFAIGRYSSTTAEFWSNGVRQAFSSSWLTAGSTSNTASVAVAVGSQGGAGFQTCDIAEIMFFNRDILDAERQTLDRYVKSRSYGLSY